MSILEFFFPRNFNKFGHHINIINMQGKRKAVTSFLNALSTQGG